MAQKLSDRIIQKLETPESGNVIVYDSAVPMFGVRITAKGVKSFILNYRFKQKERRITIGRFPTWSTAKARDEAQRLRREIDLGNDPLAERQAASGRSLVRELASRYLEEHAVGKTEASRTDEVAMLDKLVLPVIGKMAIEDVSFNDISRLHRTITKDTPIRANRVVALLSKMFSLSVQWGYRKDNPCIGVKKNPEEKRERYLTTDEMERLHKALADHRNQNMANVVRILLLTGARRGEVLNATWDQVDLKNGVWTKPSSHTKQRKLHRVPLSDAAVVLLKEIEKAAGNSIFVFPGSAPDQPIKNIKRFWQSVCKMANLHDLRIHDLRHTYASLLVSAGHSLPIIGALLGHSQAQTTARYAHLYDDPLRAATNSIAGQFKN
ncbi:MAG: tyrosine-type recombinase/integrase [Alphaproteobacteria bacterium]|nr:tyrosine-type recombinase/integrase [Alphaproteobacteria bacterium]